LALLVYFNDRHAGLLSCTAFSLIFMINAHRFGRLGQVLARRNFFLFFFSRLLKFEALVSIRSFRAGLLNAARHVVTKLEHIAAFADTAAGPERL
jgi:hypothetical protein